MSPFTGFTSKETFAQIPDSLLQMLNEIDDLAELKTSLFALWRIERMEGNLRALRPADFTPSALGLTGEEIQRGLEKSLARGILIQAQREAQTLYFLNSPRGRLSAEAFAKGQWNGADISAPRSQSNVFRLYEQNLGALTPLLADMLREAERAYPAAWFEEAFEIAVSKNIRNWKYVEAILKRWKENGKDERQNQQDAEKTAKRYSDSEFSEFINRD
ncbi:MAG: DnaD domain protein [Anaerolineales bacterium]